MTILYAARMRIAKPMLLVTTPIGVGWGIIEAARFHWWLALLMTLLVAVIAAFFWMTVARVRSEAAERAAAPADPRQRDG
jgi:membrane protein implicated in regulation of membrane protease activity